MEHILTKEACTYCDLWCIRPNYIDSAMLAKHEAYCKKHWTGITRTDKTEQPKLTSIQ